MMIRTQQECYLLVNIHGSRLLNTNEIITQGTEQKIEEQANNTKSIGGKMKNTKGKLNYRLKLKLEMKGMKTYGMKLGWNGELELHHATWRYCSKISEGSRHLKLSIAHKMRPSKEIQISHKSLSK